ncbi:MAG: carboxypeptidase-like regulatory domain-containing protein [Flavobacteriales bacterium]|nr:carboxypeptidase-like regulatory domain-containing protein [Flavobacteriales bacterium]
MRIAISIPKPCHEDWNAMTPQQGARFCDTCQHSVADLTTASDAELVALFTSDAKPKCARFDPRQLERVLGDPQPSRHTLPIAAFSSLLAVAAGQEAMAQGGPIIQVKGEPAISAPPPPNTLRMGKMRIDPPQPVDTVPVIKMGEVMPVPHSIPAGLDPEGMITGDTVVMRQDLITGQAKIRLNCASVNGTYYYIDGVKVEAGAGPGLPKSAIEEVQLITGGLPGTFGDVDGGISFRSDEPACTDTADVRALPLSGRVVDATTGAVLRGVTVEWVEEGLHCCTDVNGLFGFPAKTEGKVDAITLRIQSVGHAPQERSVPMTRLPFCVPIALPRSTTPAIEPVEQQLERPMMMGAMVITQKPTLWERVKGPFRRE